MRFGGGILTARLGSIFTQGTNHIAERQQAPINGHALLETRPDGARAFGAFGAGQVNQVKLGAYIPAQK